MNASLVRILSGRRSNSVRGPLDGNFRRFLKIRREVDRSERGNRPQRKTQQRNGAEINDTGLSVALVGRPNVGKSTLFNCLLDKNEARGYRAIVHPTPGITRDVTFASALLYDFRFQMFDTAGLEEHLKNTKRRKRIDAFFKQSSVASLAAMDDSEVYRALYRDMALKTALAVKEADVAFLLVDAKEGLTDVDRQISQWLRGIHDDQTIVLVGNKYDSHLAEKNYHDFYELGLGEPTPVSATQGLGLADLYVQTSTRFEHALKLKFEKEKYEREKKEREEKESSIVLSDPINTGKGEEASLVSFRKDQKKVRTKLEKQFEEAKRHKEMEIEEGDVALPTVHQHSSAWKKATDENLRDILVCIVGRPNVGKSTLVNKLIGKNICLTGPAPGVTRDAVWIDYVWKGKPVKLVDTAGLRKRADVESQIEELCSQKTLTAIQSSHIALLVMEATGFWSKAEQKIARMALDEGRGLIVALNKWDLIPEDERKNVKSDFDYQTGRLFPATRGVKMVAISALHMKRHFDLLDAACSLYERWSGYLKTTDLNAWLTEFKKLVPIPKRKTGGKNAKKFNLLFVAQTKTRPPTFTFRGAATADVPALYQRTLENSLRKQFDWEGVPIRLKFLPREMTDRTPAKIRSVERKDGRVEARRVSKGEESL